MELKARGAFIARQLSYAGAKFAEHYADCSDEFRADYDEAAELWADTRTEFLAVGQLGLLRDSSGKCRKLIVMRRVYGAMQAFFRTLCTASKVQAVVELTKQSLKDEHAVVIGIQSTARAALPHAVLRRASSSPALQSCLCSSHPLPPSSATAQHSLVLAPVLRTDRRARLRTSAPSPPPRRRPGTTIPSLRRSSSPPQTCARCSARSPAAGMRMGLEPTKRLNRALQLAGSRSYADKLPLHTSSVSPPF